MANRLPPADGRSHPVSTTERCPDNGTRSSCTVAGHPASQPTGPRAGRPCPRERRRGSRRRCRPATDWEVTIAWRCAQQLREVYHASTVDEGRRRAEVVLATLHACPIPETARLGRTLRSWRVEFLAYFTTGGASNGPTEAINLLIEKHRRDAHGFRNFRNCRLRLLLACGLDWHHERTARIRTRRPRFVA
jgi:hypothetical protein